MSPLLCSSYRRTHAAAAEGDTQPAADGHEAAQGTDAAESELQRDAAAAARDDSRTAHRNTGQHGGNDSRLTGVTESENAQGAAAATKGMQAQDRLAAAAQAQAHAQEPIQTRAHEQEHEHEHEHEHAAGNTQHTGVGYLAATQGTAAAQGGPINLSPNRLMQKLVRFEVHDPALHSGRDRQETADKWTYYAGTYQEEQGTLVQRFGDRYRSTRLHSRSSKPSVHWRNR